MFKIKVACIILLCIMIVVSLSSCKNPSTSSEISSITSSEVSSAEPSSEMSSISQETTSVSSQSITGSSKAASPTANTNSSNISNVAYTSGGSATINNYEYLFKPCIIFVEYNTNKTANYFGYTPPNYIKSSDPNHILNYAIDYCRMLVKADEVIKKYNITRVTTYAADSMLEEKYGFSNSSIVLSQYASLTSVYNYYVQQGKLTITDSDRADYFAKNNVSVLQLHVEVRITDSSYKRVKEITSALSETMEYFKTHQYDAAIMDALQSKYSYALFSYPDVKYNGAEVKSVDIIGYSNDNLPEYGLSVDATKYAEIDPYNVKLILWKKFYKMFSSESSSIKFTININNIVNYYTSKSYLT